MNVFEIYDFNHIPAHLLKIASEYSSNLYMNSGGIFAAVRMSRTNSIFPSSSSVWGERTKLIPIEVRKNYV